MCDVEVFLIPNRSYQPRNRDLFSNLLLTIIYTLLQLTKCRDSDLYQHSVFVKKDNSLLTFRVKPGIFERTKFGTMFGCLTPIVSLPSHWHSIPDNEESTIASE